MYEIIKQLLIMIFNVPEFDIEMDTELEEDLGMDEIHKMQLYIALEEELGIEINFDEILKFKTINEIAQYLEKEDYERS